MHSDRHLERGSSNMPVVLLIVAAAVIIVAVVLMRGGGEEPAATQAASRTAAPERSARETRVPARESGSSSETDEGSSMDARPGASAAQQRVRPTPATPAPTTPEQGYETARGEPAPELYREPGSSELPPEITEALENPPEMPESLRRAIENDEINKIPPEFQAAIDGPRPTVPAAELEALKRQETEVYIPPDVLEQFQEAARRMNESK